jgi:xyloglucan-specific exo-beta-1,4-glucanase
LHLTTDNGNSWTNLGLINEIITSIKVSASNVFVSTSQNGIYYSSNYGNNWISINNGLPTDTISSLSIYGNYLFAGTSHHGIWKRLISNITNIELNEKIKDKILVYPTISNYEIFIESQSNDIENSLFSIYNVQGQKILSQKIKQMKTVIDISGFSKGIYILKLISNDNYEVKKFVKE